MNEIQEIIKKKESEIGQLQDDINALRRAEKILRGSSGGVALPKSQPKMAYSILDDAGKPMHVKMIAEQMQKRFQQNVKVANLGVMLFRYAQREKSFYKVKGKPNTYGLIKWESPIDRAMEKIEKIKLFS